MTQNKEAIAKEPKTRVRRQALSRRNVLTVNGKEPGYVYRVVNDTEDRVQEFQEMGYEVVKSSEVSVGDKRVDKGASEGSVKRVSVGGGKYGVVMRQKEEFYKEDQQAKLDYVAETERATQEKALSGTYGKLERKESNSF